MKKIFMLLAVAIVGISMTGCYDDDELWNEMESVKNRVTTLEEAVQKTNDDLTALQTIVSSTTVIASAGICSVWSSVARFTVSAGFTDRRRDTAKLSPVSTLTDFGSSAV